MRAYLEAWTPSGARLVPLEGDRLSVGNDPSNDVAIKGDPMVSRLHGVLERYASGWAIRDLGSHNGTFVNGERLWGERRLRPGDEIRIGRSRLVFNTDAPAPPRTESVEPAPQLTPRERDVMQALCRPVLGGDMFTEPASIKEIAAALVVTEAAVKQHLVNLYDKFGIFESGARRNRLANEAIRRGAVNVADLRDPQGH